MTDFIYLQVREFNWKHKEKVCKETPEKFRRGPEPERGVQLEEGLPEAAGLRLLPLGPRGWGGGHKDCSGGLSGPVGVVHPVLLLDLKSCSRLDGTDQWLIKARPGSKVWSSELMSAPGK